MRFYIIKIQLLSEKVMKSVKIKLCLIIALAFTFIASAGAFIGRITAKANRYVTLSGTSIFYTAGSAEIWAHRVEHKIPDETAGEVDDPYYYTMFTFETDDDAVSYRRNLAYSWFYNEKDRDDSDTDSVGGSGEEGEDTPHVAPEISCAKGYFHMEIGFEEINFEKFVITFETQQFGMTEDKKTVNYIIFVPAEGGVNAVITAEKERAEAKAEDIDVSESALLGTDHINIALSGGENGVYDVDITNAEGFGAEDSGASAVQKGTFENVGKMYAKYVSSTTNPVIPLSFKADMPEKADTDRTEVRARMAIYEMNGQSFALNRNSEGATIQNPSRDINEVDDGEGKVHYTGGQVNDTTPPVLCLDKGLRYIAEGSEISFAYTAVDVLTQSPSLETGYFLLTKEQAADAEFNANDYTADKLFRIVKDSDDQYVNPHANHYVPQEGDYKAESFEKGFAPDAAIKIYLKITDTASTGGQSTYIMLDWFVDENYVITVNNNNYIAVANDTEGAHYNTESADWDTLVEEYQAEVTKAAEDLRAGKDDFYLPSLEKLVSDNATAYADMTYSIYFMVNGTKSSSTGNSASSLSIDLTAAGDYLFTVYASDSASNKMWYLKESETQDGEPEVVEFETGDIWTIYDDEDLHSKLPWFTFSAGIADISVEDPGEQDTAYVGTSYTGKAFEINGVSTSAAYTLYIFNNDLYKERNGEVLTYSQFMERKQELFEGEGRIYFTNIAAVADLDEDSEEYEEFAKYSWNASARSFVPQDENSFYLIKCEVTSTQFPTIEPVKAYMGIAASVTPAALDGEDTWLQDNMVSVILLAVAGVAFIGIILLLVIKPKEKGDVDEMYAKEEAAKDAKKNK